MNVKGTLSIMEGFEAHPYPTSTLYREEIDAIILVACQIASKYLRSLQGTFILDGQPHDHPAHCICRFNLKDGPCNREFFCGGKGDSRELAAESIDQLLKTDTERTRYRNIWPHDFNNVDGCKCVSGGIFCDGNLNVMVLNCTYGKFLTASYLDVNTSYAQDGNLAILIAVATTLSKILQEDITLQRSFSKIRQNYDFSYVDVVQEVHEMFVQRSLLGLRKWSQWHESANQLRRPCLPYEEYLMPKEELV